MKSVKEQIFENIERMKYKAFTTADFIHIGSYKSISKALECLEDEKKIRRIIRGVYDCPKISYLFGIEEAPDIQEVAYAIARQYNWNICPSGNVSLNIIGISTQVPSKYVFISDGPYRKYQINKLEIEFKHSTTREIINLPYELLVAIQAIKTIGKEEIKNFEILLKIKKYLKGFEDEIFNIKYPITSWVYEVLKDITKGD